MFRKKVAASFFVCCPRNFGDRSSFFALWALQGTLPGADEVLRQQHADRQCRQYRCPKRPAKMILHDLSPLATNDLPIEVVHSLDEETIRYVRKNPHISARRLAEAGRLVEDVP